MRLRLLAATAAAIAACTPPVALPTPTPGNDTGLQDQLFAADRAYARAVADSGHAAWVARFAPDIAKPGAGGLLMLRGVDPVSGLDKGMFADATRRLVIKPETTFRELLEPVFRQGKRVLDLPTLTESRAHAQREVHRLDPGIRRFLNPHAFPVGLEKTLYDHRTQLILEKRPVRGA